jgi:hypothetical protein
MTPVAFLFSVLRQTLFMPRLELVLFPLNNGFCLVCNTWQEDLSRFLNHAE